ncbi:MAG: STAS/SEC14 domain-containing protein [Candidatus Nanopelagicales bacterium]
MILVLTDMPEGTVGFEAVGEVTSDDYRDVLAPALQRELDGGQVRLLCLLDDRFEGYSPGAWVQDAKMWLGHLGTWEKVALVTDHDGIARALDAFAWMMPGEARSFPVDQLDAAKTWVAATD